MDSDIPLGTCALYTLEPTAKKFKIGEIGVSRKDIFQQLLTLASEEFAFYPLTLDIKGKGGCK